jgi:hypothetical protein
MSCVLSQGLTIATLTLDSRTKQGLAKVRATSEAQESHFMLSKVWGSVKEWTSTFSNELPKWELESQWTPKFSENDCKGQKLLNWSIPYTIGKLLEITCQKGVRMTHLGN